MVFSQASECLQVVAGLELKELDPEEHIYKRSLPWASPEM